MQKKQRTIINLVNRVVKRKYKADLCFLCIASIVALFCCSGHLSAATEQVFSGTLKIEEALTAKPSGTPGREENEFKLLASGSAEILKNNSYILGKMRVALEKAFNNDLLWKAPLFTGSEYSVMEVGMGTFCFLDIYLDSEDGLNYRENISYRVRYRWHSRSSLFRYLLGSRNPADFPHRCEYQLKVYEVDWQEGFNNCQETRFEFRNESFPFKTSKSAPSAPWPFEEFIKPAITGKYAAYNVITTFAYAKALKEKLGLSGELLLKPSLIVVTTRRRIHLGLKNEFGMKAADMGLGSAVNSDQAILITLDTSEIYPNDFLDIHRYAKFAVSKDSLSSRLKKRIKSMFVPIKTFTELEFEFERNIESALALELEKASSDTEKQRLINIKAAFIEDVKTTSKIVSEALNKIGIATEAGKSSKYRQAFDTLKIKP